ncbi:MAG: hypothetical protein GC151_11235 [Betaproteobacteria bacterium]|nr:hypothetical protein [Betaproteobacteria bacterium]
MKFVGQLLGSHRSRYPAMEIADIYKLLHQAALGPAHLVQAGDARATLRAELAACGQGPDEPLADVISPDGRLARVHLRTFAARGLDPDRLADAFVQTAQDYPGSPDKLAKFCGCLGDLADAGGIPFARADVEAYMSARGAEGWPAVHHSQAYRAAYAPAYRVVDLERLPEVAAEGLRP